MRYNNSYENKILDSIDNRLWKEKLYKRAFETIKEHSLSYETFKKNIFGVYLWLLDSKEIKEILDLPQNKVSLFKKIINTHYFKKYIENENEELVVDESNALYDTMDYTEEAFLSFHEQFWYTRAPWCSIKESRQKKFNEKTWKYSVESFVFNRLYEMMLTQLIQKHLQDTFGHEFSIKGIKTSTFDDTMTWTDIIVMFKNKKNARRFTVWIDHICGTSKQSIDKKSVIQSTLCPEFCSSRWRWRYKKIPRLVRNTNPGISFLLFEWYIGEIVSWTMPDAATMKKVFYEIIQANPILYKQSINSWLDVEQNIENISNELSKNFTLIQR